ncbi:sensor histidine kinase [Cohnella zeiphila]|uniref:histidine kinase n=1 Tax=Cohnella zeiphila TaxID=2761120 RepID=A0A7X0SKQ3_9BACL|nr:HAMP domain-containing sensor histidine kinase [Cohnella zeiphila]MBB6731788.1 HAMP domain-containing histidine kinase [Cohnella zeiphila]
MSKLARKLIVRLAAALCVVFVLSCALNTYFLPKYFLHQSKVKLAGLTAELSPLPYDSLVSRIDALEKEEQVAIASASLTESENDLNGELLLQWSRKGIALSKFWLTGDNIDLLRAGGKVNKIYDQTKLKSGFLVNFFPVDGYVFAVGESISHSSETMRIVNRFNLYIWSGMLLLLTVLSVLYATRIVRPLAELNETAEAISRLSFVKPDIRTGDEIESLANSLGRMSDRLKEAHRSLEVKNANLQSFIADISHELKTPLSLIQVYAAGIQDGLDDGTYAGVIRLQSEEMSGLIDRLLELSRRQADTYEFAPVELRPLLDETLAPYQVAASQQGLAWETDDRLSPEAAVMADRPKLESVLRNLISNAIKYTTDGRIVVTMETKNGNFYFRVANGTDIDDAKKWERVWEPFFVMESSRSKKFSGTGLGLSIAAAVLQSHHADYGYELDRGTVTFYFSLPLIRE